MPMIVARRLPVCASLAAAALLVMGCEISEGPAPARAQDEAAPEEDAADQDPPTVLDCFVTVRRRTTLQDTEALELCRGSRSLGPYECFRDARRRTSLQDALRIQLCRCAEGAAPVRCYRRFKRDALLDDVTVVNQCRPVVARKLTQSCIPIRLLL